MKHPESYQLSLAGSVIHCFSKLNWLTKDWPGTKVITVSGTVPYTRLLPFTALGISNNIEDSS